VASELSSAQSLTHAAVARGPIWLCAFGPEVLHGCTLLLYINAISSYLTNDTVAYASGGQTVGLSPIVGRSALFIEPRITYCCGPCGM